MNNFLNSIDVSQMVNDIKEIRETVNGRHYLSELKVGVSKSGRKHIMLDFIHTANADNGIKDYLRFSSVDAFLTSFNRIKYAFEHLSDVERPLSNLALPQPFIVEMNPATTGVESSPKEYIFNAQELFVSSGSDISVFQKAKQQWFNDIKSALGEGWELLENTDKKSTIKTEDGKEVSDVQYYYAVKMEQQNVDIFVNKIIELGQSLIKKVCVLNVSEKEEGKSFQNVQTYIESKI